MNHYDFLAGVLTKMLNTSDGMRTAQLNLVTSPFAESIRTCWFEIYNSLTHRKIIEKIENLEQTEKTELWNQVKQMAPELNQEQRIKTAKALYAMEFWLRSVPDAG